MDKLWDKRPAAGKSFLGARWAQACRPLSEGI